MDPNATLATILDAGTDDDTRRAATRDLNGWLKAGGFGPRVQTHPATDAWMVGDRYGTVTRVAVKYVTVRMDRSGRSLRFTRDYLMGV